MSVEFNLSTQTSRASGSRGQGNKMTTIKISRDVPTSTVAKISAHLDSVLLHDVNFSGDEFSIERGDFTYVDDCDEIAGSSLLIAINDIIESATLTTYQVSANGTVFGEYQADSELVAVEVVA